MTRGALPAEAARTADVRPTAEVPVAPRRPRWRRHRRLLAAGAVALAALGASLGVAFGTGGTSPRSSSTPVVRTVTKVVDVTTGTMSQSVSVQGGIQPAEVANLDFAVAGRVTAVDVTTGQSVVAGQPLASVAPTALEAQEASALSALDAAEAKLDADRASGATTAQLAADEAAVASAQAQYTTAKKAVAAAVLTSTITGEVASVSLTVGEQVTASGGGTSNGGGGSAGPTSGSGSSGQVQVVSTDRFVIDTSVDDTEVGELAVGDQALVTTTGGSQVTGSVTFVGLVSSGNGIPSFPVTIAITDPSSPLYAGSFAHVQVLVKQLHDVLEVPTPAIAYRQGRAVVTLVGSGGARSPQAVTVGTTSGGMTEITGGLSAGERVLVREKVVVFRGGVTKKGTVAKGAKGNVFVGTAPVSVKSTGGVTIVRSAAGTTEILHG